MDEHTMAARVLPELRVAAVQFEPRPADKSFNLARIAAFVEQASAQGVQLVAFPEMCLVGYWHLRKLTRDQLVGLAEPISGPSVAAVSALACRNGIGIGYLEVDERGLLYNAYAVCLPDGQIHCHRKLHAFEHDSICSGDRFTVFDTPWSVRVGVLICWDNNLVENVRATALLGAEVIMASEITRSTGELGGALLLGAPLLMLLLGAVAWFLTGRALRPVEAIRAQVASISGTDLHRRLPVGDARDELQRLTRTFNQMLDRIEDSSAQQRRFLADAAHELRTPVASIHTRLQVHTRHRQLPLTLPEQQLLAADAARLAALIGSLLSLARLDSQTALRRDPVDLDDLILDHTRRVRAEHPRLRVDTTQVSGAQVAGDRDTLDQVVANLVDNAAQHAATTITVHLHSTDAAAILTIADDGPGIPAADRHRVFERFTRLDDARSRNTGGTGLGLSIVADIVHAHHGTVHITDNRPGARLAITLPTTQQDTPPVSSFTPK